MLRAKQIPVPGLVSNQERQNLEVPQGQVLNYVYFEFRPEQFRRAKFIKTIPANHIVVDWFINVVEPFNGNSTELSLGDGPNPARIMSNIITVKGVHSWGSAFAPTGTTVVGTVLTKPMNISATLRIISSGGAKPTQGFGYGIIEYLNLGLVEGFGRLL